MREANERRGDDHGVNLCLGTPVRLANRGMLPASRRRAQQMKRTIMWSVLLILTLLSSRSEAQSTDDVARQLSGMWRLVSNPQRLADGTTRQGTNGVPNIGYAFFDATGSHMCFLMMTPNRPVWAGATPTPEEGLAALRGINTYCATLEIHAKEGFMDRRYDINQNPNAVGKATRRWYTFQGPDRMTLRVDAAELTKPVVETLFIWERVTK
jgi:hypothetical protein